MRDDQQDEPRLSNFHQASNPKLNEPSTSKKTLQPKRIFQGGAIIETRWLNVEEEAHSVCP